MSLNGRTQVSSVPEASAMQRDSGCAARTFPVTFKVNDNGKSYVAMRSGEPIGGIVFKPGGWFAFEVLERQVGWSKNGRVRAHFAARDLWGADASAAVARLPEIKAEATNAPA